MTTGDKTEGRLRVRPMEPEDITAVLAIDQSVSGVKRAITYTDLITGDLGGVLNLSVVAELNGTVVGFILARHALIGEPFYEVGFIHIIGVDPDQWRQGIATKMVGFLLERCRAKGLKTVRIMLNEKDSQLQGLFSHLGFRRGNLIDYNKTL
ncbi:MAG TPA: GNAT family N-acetyltransferase [Dehalococcoidia bacterium]|nr:GNAT family N-acetyltransferase [Dehalococcoidia bacterium]